MINPSNSLVRRQGFSLLEILLALAILGGSLALLSQIAETGTWAAREARDLSVAKMICQTKLAELLLDSAAGIQPLSVPPAPATSFDSQSSTPFVYSVDVGPAPIDGLLAIRVNVEAQDTNGGPSLATFSLTRWIVDPARGLEALEEEERAMKKKPVAETELQ